MKSSTLAFLLIMTLQLKAQTNNFIYCDTLDIISNDSIRFYLSNYYGEKELAESAEVKILHKYKLLRWFPNMGITYALTPYISWDANRVITVLDDRANKKARLENIRRTNDLLFKSSVSEALISRSQLLEKIKAYNFQRTVFILESEKLALAEKKYNQKELLPSEYLNMKIAYEHFKISINNLLIQLQNEKKEILKLSKKI
jgi:hypothetical protein